MKPRKPKDGKKRASAVSTGAVTHVRNRGLERDAVAALLSRSDARGSCFGIPATVPAWGPEQQGLPRPPRLSVAAHLRASDPGAEGRAAAALLAVQRQIAARRVAALAVDAARARPMSTPGSRGAGLVSAAVAGAMSSPLPDVEAKLRALTEQMIERTLSSGGALHGMTPIPETAFHDFAEYRFIRDPDLLSGTTVNSNVVATVNELLVSAVGALHNFIDVLPKVGTAVWVLITDAIFNRMFQAFKRLAAYDLYEFIAVLVPGYAGSSGRVIDDVVAVFMTCLREHMPTSLIPQSEQDKAWDAERTWGLALNDYQGRFMKSYPDATITLNPAPAPPSYSFLPFPSGFVNMGLRVVYRQEWRPLGTQPGEIVRTVPLGPKQTVKVSTRVVSTEKTSRSTEITTSSEVSAETSSTTKDSSDVIREASDKLNWHIDAEASGGFLGFNVGVKTGIAKETASSSKDAKSRLNETMQKTASRMTRNTKVVVSVEREVTSESSTTSEITNPNEELAVTYVYSKLQRQYEIATSLAEVNSVVFIPEPLPRYDEINEDWIRRYDWILSRVLLDDSFGEDLIAVARGVDEPAIDPADKQALADGAAKARAAIGDYKQYTGGDSLRFISTAQEIYDRMLERQRSQQTAARQRAQQLQRLQRHLRDNILYYMRAIWGAEDADQRLRRYAQISVPTMWTFVPFGSVAIPAEGGSFATGTFVPDMSADSLRPVTELINPAGPIGYAGNYAVFYLKSDLSREAALADPQRLHLDHVLAIMRAAYAASEVLLDGDGASGVRSASVLSPRHDVAEYEVVRSGPASWTATMIVAGNRSDVQAVVATDDLTVVFDGVRVVFDEAPIVGAKLRVRVRTLDQLEDPELRALREAHPLPVGEAERALFAPALLDEIASFLPVVSAALAGQLDWDLLSDPARGVVRAHYHEFLLVREHTRQLLLDTNNVVVDVDLGTTPILEDFKRLHRGVDVLKELEEAVRRRLENARRDARLISNDLADPEIENVTMVSVPQAPTSVPVVVGAGTTNRVP